MTAAVETSIVPYEVRLDRDRRWALVEGSLFFEKQSAVHQALARICQRLSELGIPYAVCGGMALFQHGFRRFTDDVDLLVTREDLQRIHSELEGRGYLPVFSGSKNLRDTEVGVRIEFLVTGQYPGDGKPKPVAFPHPESAAIELNGFHCLQLSKLVELKLASGMTVTERVKDLGDVQELIKLLHLPLEFSETLDPFVRGKYAELWNGAMGRPKKYYRIWPIKLLATEAATLPEMVHALRAAADELQCMLNDGVVLDPERGTSDDHAYLTTTDPEVARRYDMHDESEFLDTKTE